MKKILISSLLALSLSGCAGMMAGVQPADASVAQNLDCAPYPENYQEMIQTYLSQRLIDPLSALYEIYKPEKAQYKGGCGWYIHAYFNAKNRFGGYTGKKLSQFIIYNGQLEEINTFQSGMVNGLNK